MLKIAEYSQRAAELKNRVIKAFDEAGIEFSLKET